MLGDNDTIEIRRGKRASVTAISNAEISRIDRAEDLGVYVVICSMGKDAFGDADTLAIAAKLDMKHSEVLKSLRILRDKGLISID